MRRTTRRVTLVGLALSGASSASADSTRSGKRRAATKGGERKQPPASAQRPPVVDHDELHDGEAHAQHRRAEAFVPGSGDPSSAKKLQSAASPGSRVESRSHVTRGDPDEEQDEEPNRIEPLLEDTASTSDARDEELGPLPPDAKLRRQGEFPYADRVADKDRPQQPAVFDHRGKEMERDPKTGRLLKLYDPDTGELARLFDEHGRELVVVDVARGKQSTLQHHDMENVVVGGGQVHSSIDSNRGTSSTSSSARRTEGRMLDSQKRSEQVRADATSVDSSAESSSSTSSQRPGDHHTRTVSAKALQDGRLQEGGSSSSTAMQRRHLPQSSSKDEKQFVTSYSFEPGREDLDAQNVEITWIEATSTKTEGPNPRGGPSNVEAEDTRALEGRGSTTTTSKGGEHRRLLGEPQEDVGSPEEEEFSPGTRSRTLGGEVVEVAENEDRASSSVLAESRAAPELKQGSRPLPSAFRGAGPYAEDSPRPGKKNYDSALYRSTFHKDLPEDLAVRQLQPGIFVMDRASAFSKEASLVQKLLEYSLSGGTQHGLFSTSPLGEAASLGLSGAVLSSAQHPPAEVSSVESVTVFSTTPAGVWSQVSTTTVVHRDGSREHSESQSLMSPLSEPRSQPPAKDKADKAQTTMASANGKQKPEDTGKEKASAEDKCFYQNTVCRECNGRDDCLERNQLNLLDYGDVDEDGGGLSSSASSSASSSKQPPRSSDAETPSAAAAPTTVETSRRKLVLVRKLQERDEARRRSQEEVPWPHDSSADSASGGPSPSSIGARDVVSVPEEHRKEGDISFNHEVMAELSARRRAAERGGSAMAHVGATTDTSMRRHPKSLVSAAVEQLRSWQSIGEELAASYMKREGTDEQFNASLEAERVRRRQRRREEALAFAKSRLLGINKQRFLRTRDPSLVSDQQASRGQQRRTARVKQRTGVDYVEDLDNMDPPELRYRQLMERELASLQKPSQSPTPEVYSKLSKRLRAQVAEEVASGVLPSKLDHQSRASTVMRKSTSSCDKMSSWEDEDDAMLGEALDSSRSYSTSSTKNSRPLKVSALSASSPRHRRLERKLKAERRQRLPAPGSLRQLQDDASLIAWKTTMGFTDECIGSTGNSTLRELEEIAPGPGGRKRGVIAQLERQMERDRRRHLRRLDGQYVARRLLGSPTNFGKESDFEVLRSVVEPAPLTLKDPAKLLARQRELQTYLKSTFTGQTDQCLCYHENTIFKPVLDLFPVMLPDFRECLTKHFAMGDAWESVCTLDDACKYASRIAAEMQLVDEPREDCNCELCTWGEAWHAPGQSSASCPNNHAELWREICQPCKKKSSVDIAAMSDADVPKRDRFEKIGEKGECTDKSLRYVRGRGGVAESHTACRDMCWQAVGLDCLGYSYYHCSKRCIIHLRLEGMNKLSRWTKVKGEGDIIHGTDGACGSECYRVTYGQCPPGQIASGGVDVTWESTMVYGQSEVFKCPSPYTGQVTITCGGANSQTVEGMCLEPCPSGSLIYRPGLSPIPYPVTPIATRRRLPCPFDPTNPSSNIELLCQSDRSILIVSPNCGASCAPGMYTLSIGGGIIPYDFMTHRQRLDYFQCPFGYVGVLDLICIDGVVTEQRTPGTGCFLHCSAVHAMDVPRAEGKNSTSLDVQLRAEFNLTQPQWIGNPSRLYQNETLQLSSMSSQFLEGIFFKHGTLLDAPCKPSPLTYGIIRVSCNNGIIEAQDEDCKYNCPAGEIEAAEGGHSLKMYHSYLPDWHSVEVVCPPAQWTGTVQLSCRNGVLSRREGGVCMRHCNVDFLVSNGLNIFIGKQLKHNSTTAVDCVDGGNPNFAGKLKVHCNNGAVAVEGRCGKFCGPTMIVSNDAMVLTFRQDHDETRGYPCPSPWTGTLSLLCDDKNLITLASCGQRCDASTILVRGVTNMPFPTVNDVAMGMQGIDHGDVYEAGCPAATDALSYTGNLFLQCDNGVTSVRSGHCYFNCNKMVVNSGGFPQSIEYMAHNTTGPITCAAGLDTGYLILKCFDQELEILEGSCTNSPCSAGVVSVAATRFLRSTTLACPEPLTGMLTLACNTQVISVPFSDCGDRCQINGTILPNIINNLGLPIYGGIRVATPLMDHSTRQTVACPGQTKGMITFECQDGTPKQVDGGCNNPCQPSQFTTPTGAIVQMLYMEHNETRYGMECPIGTTRGGTIDVTCLNGTHHRTGGVCLTDCPAREFTSNTVMLRHPSIAHGQSYQAQCSSWNNDYTGLITIACFQGKVNETGRCNRHCPPGAVVSNGATVPHEQIDHGVAVNLTCALANVGTIDFAHTLQLSCSDGKVLIDAAYQNDKKNLTGTCMRNCLGPTKLFGTSFNHQKIIEGTMVQVQCPGPGLLMLQCIDGIASPFESKCFQTCPPSTLSTLKMKGVQRIETVVTATWDVSITHDVVYPAPCDPTIATGYAEIQCMDGVARVQASFCKLKCDAGDIIQEDPEDLYKFDIRLSHGDLVDAETEVVQCPSHLAGRATVQCDDSIVKIVAGSCGTSNCMPSELLSGENLMISYPQMNHAETYETDCGAGFIGRIRFRCEEGVATREWIRMNYLNQMSNTVETVELCECCLTNGVSALTVGDGTMELGSGNDQLVGWISAGGLFMIVILAVLHYNSFWSRHVTPRIRDSQIMRYLRARSAAKSAATRSALQAKLASSQNKGISRALENVQDDEEEESSGTGTSIAPLEVEDAAKGIEDAGYESKVSPQIEDGEVV
ncbi:unnamed protein product [Amoebophrya sp. A25]|nr:unnamed protein product [Amoebophrya sp. A25]|eukprot:GSA25T00025577001.1